MILCGIRLPFSAGARADRRQQKQSNRGKEIQNSRLAIAEHRSEVIDDCNRTINRATASAYRIKQMIAKNQSMAVCSFEAWGDIQAIQNVGELIFSEIQGTDTPMISRVVEDPIGIMEGYNQAAYWLEEEAVFKGRKLAGRIYQPICPSEEYDARLIISAGKEPFGMLIVAPVSLGIDIGAETVSLALNQ